MTKSLKDFEICAPEAGSDISCQAIHCTIRFFTRFFQKLGFPGCFQGVVVLVVGRGCGAVAVTGVFVPDDGSEGVTVPLSFVAHAVSAPAGRQTQSSNAKILFMVSHPGAHGIDKAAVEQYVRKSGGEVITKKGATFYAVAISAVHICKCIFSGVDTALTVSTMMHGEYGVSDVCLSTLSMVGNRGVKTRMPADLTPAEEELLRHSAKCLRDVIDQVKF